MDKPPIGLRPRWIVTDARIFEIIEAMTRYREGGATIPSTWWNELAQLSASMAARAKTLESGQKPMDDLP